MYPHESPSQTQHIEADPSFSNKCICPASNAANSNTTLVNASKPGQNNTHTQATLLVTHRPVTEVASSSSCPRLVALLFPSSEPQSSVLCSTIFESSASYTGSAIGLHEWRATRSQDLASSSSSSNCLMRSSFSRSEGSCDPSLLLSCVTSRTSSAIWSD